MACSGLSGDYLCAGWRERTAAIRARDGNRCRGCNRPDSEVRLEVHHRTYGSPGSCGACVLTGITDEDLTTLCTDCHDAITDTRRRLRYGQREISVEAVPLPEVRVTVTRRCVEIDVAPVDPPRQRGIVPVRIREL